jgi:hypothetical protein
MKLTGKIFRIMDTQNVSATYKKREFVLEVAENPAFPQMIKLELSQDRCSVLDKFKLGQIVECDINLRGRIWINPQGVETFFNTIEAWKIAPVGTEIQPTTTNVKEELYKPQPPENVNPQEFTNPVSDDLPF